VIFENFKYINNNFNFSHILYYFEITSFNI